jgi:type II secretory pathway component PulF
VSEANPAKKTSEARPLAPPSRPRGSGFKLRNLMYGIIAVALVFAAAKEVGVVTTSIFVIGAAVGGIIVIFGQRHATRQEALLWVLSIAAARRMPLAQGVASFSHLTTGGFRSRVYGLAQLLNAGLSLPDALDRVPGVIPGSAAVMARVGWESGTLPAALKDAAEHRETYLPVWKTVLIKLEYPLILLLIMQVIDGFILYFISPKFQAIFADFGMKLPAITTRVIEFSQSPLTVIGVGVFDVIDVILICLLPAVFFGWIDLRVPFLDRLFPHSHMSIIFRSLGIVIDAGQPLTVGLNSLARSYPVGWMRQRLVRVARGVDQGTSWTTALQSQGLLTESQLAVLESADRVGNLGWSLRELADAGDRRFNYRVQLIAQFLFPLVMFMAGFLVFTLAVAYFMPLVQLIERLSG